MTLTWMPVSDTLREYALEPEIHYWDYGHAISSKGHHDPVEFLEAAVTEWAAENDDSLVLYHDNTWSQMEGPVWPPAVLRDPKYVRHEWWATRCMSPLDGYAYYVNPVQPWERGAYPVTVVDL